MTHLRVYDKQLGKMLYDIRPDSLPAKVYCSKMFQNTDGLSDLVKASLERFVFMPWVGIVDRNDKPIFAEDILDCWGNYGMVLKGKRKIVEFRVTGRICGWNIGKGYTEIRWEVVGNKFENSELMGIKKYKGEYHEQRVR